MADKARVTKKSAKTTRQTDQPKQEHQQQSKASTEVNNAKGSTSNNEDEEMNVAVVELLASHERELLAVAAELMQETRHYDNELSQLSEKLTAANKRLMQLEWRFPTSALWRIGDFQAQFQDSKNSSGALLDSPQYYLSRQGYKFCMSIALYGAGEARGKYISLYVSLCKGEFDGNLPWPFNMRLYLSILDQTDDDESSRRNITKVIVPRVCRENRPFLDRPRSHRNPHFGLDRFASLDDFLRSGRQYVRNDAIFVRLEAPGEDLLPL